MAQHDIRRAMRSDFDAIMGIGEVNNGRDYLRYSYESFIDDPNNRSYVYMVGGDVIGFSATFLIDGGLSLLSRGGRVKASVQGQGIFRTLKKYVRQQYQSIESVKYEVLTTNNVNVSARPSLRESFSELSYKHDIRRATRSDFNAVMGIGEVYNGKDYLRYRYNRFLDDPNNRSYVYMVGRDVIGFSATFLIDGGLSLLSRGGRVKASFRESDLLHEQPV
ncbi:uncharacterized protein LOC124143588 [Haliotis rufescens]|uniref:uncharacterized protein LOC124143588 n=1 Tax=Haliotis rufescens TaxID=6454 RepID=UPI00201EDD7C|nr:uncharacterized protein LOC124143588 [Haliotis rufescens]